MKHLDELKKLNLPIGKYALFGSSPMAIRGIKENSDIDIIVKKDLWNLLKKKYGIIRKKSELRKEGYEVVNIGNLEIYPDWIPWFNEIDKLIENADIIEGIPFVKLEYVISWKKAFGREKDNKDILLIEKYLKKEKN